MSTMGEVDAVPEDGNRPAVPPPSPPPAHPTVFRAPAGSSVASPTGWPAPPPPAPASKPQPVGYPPAAPASPSHQQPVPTVPTAPTAPVPSTVVGVPPRPAPLPPPRDLTPAPPITPPAPVSSTYSLPSEPFTAPRPARLAPEPLARRLVNRRSRMTVRRVDPWSVFVMSLLLTLFLAVMTVIAALVLYLVLSKLGVVASINSGVDDVKGNGDIITFGRFVGVAALVAAANVIFLTAMATLGAVVYNFCATFAGGIDVTLAEGE